MVSVSAKNANLQIPALILPLAIWEPSQLDKFAVPQLLRAVLLKLLLIFALLTFARTEPVLPTPPLYVLLLQTLLASNVTVFLPLDFAKPLKPELARVSLNARTFLDVTITTCVPLKTVPSTEAVIGRLLTVPP